MECPPSDIAQWSTALEAPCASCGFGTSPVDRDRFGAALRSNAATWRSLLSRGDLVTELPPAGGPAGPATALEYGAHVLDRYETVADHVTTMLKKDQHRIPDGDPQQAAAEAAYADQDPAAVAYRLAATAGKLADVVDRVRADRWDRTAELASGGTVTLETVVGSLLHEVTHHAWQVEQAYAAILEAREDDGEPNDEGAE